MRKPLVGLPDGRVFLQPFTASVRILSVYSVGIPCFLCVLCVHVLCVCVCVCVLCMFVFVCVWVCVCVCVHVWCKQLIHCHISYFRIKNNLFRSDLGTARHTQWFYFQIQGMIPGKTYRLVSGGE